MHHCLKNGFAILLGVASAAFVSASPLEIVKDGNSAYRIEEGTGKFDSFAAKEFKRIMKAATGAEFRKTSPERIHIGITPEVESALGKDRLAGLRDQETLVTAKGKDLYLVGGGDFGTLYAVYDFLEKTTGYLMYGKYPGAEIIRKNPNLVWDGKDLSTHPVFDGFRENYSPRGVDDRLTARYLMRNRDRSQVDFGGGSVIDPAYRPRLFRTMNSQHGLWLFVPPTDAEDAYFKTKWEGMFDKHPEYFSMTPAGKREPLQLCFSNPDLRKLFTERFRIFVSKNGPGIYMVGSNDTTSNGRYCYCDECEKLVQKYKTNGGPLWDYLIELCNEIKTDLPDVYVMSLAYKGPEQTELAPEGIVFPDNFICDAAFLNSDRPLKQVRELDLPDGGKFNRFENLKKWVSITKHVSYWYYGGNSPAQVYRRMQEELKELRDAGVRSVGACGTGGGVEFQDLSETMFFQMLRNPDLDADALMKRLLEAKYGAAAEPMFRYITDLENAMVEARKFGDSVMSTDDSYEKMSFLKGADIVRWQGMFDGMEKSVADDPVRLRNVRIARVGLDCWTIIFAPKIRNERPEWKLDPEAVLKRGLAACDLAEGSGMYQKEVNPARRCLESMRYYAFLKDDSLPKEFSGEAPRLVRRYLPVTRDTTMPNAVLVKDPLAAAGVAMSAVIQPSEYPKDKIGVAFHDSLTKEWLMRGAGVPVPSLNKEGYTLVKIGTSRIPLQGMFVFGGAWGSSLDIRDLGRFYDPTYHGKLYEIWASVRVSGPMFRKGDKGENRLFCDQIFLIDRGMPKE